MKMLSIPYHKGSNSAPATSNLIFFRQLHVTEIARYVLSGYSNFKAFIVGTATTFLFVGVHNNDFLMYTIAPKCVKSFQYKTGFNFSMNHGCGYFFLPLRRGD